VSTVTRGIHWCRNNGTTNSIGALILTALLSTCFFSPAFAGVFADSQLEGKVVGVLDGDTLDVLISGSRNIRIRLSEIDAPEKSQAFGQVAKQSLSDLVFGKMVTVRVIDTDRYGRSIGRVFVSTTDVNLTQVQRGLAWAYERYVTDARVTAAEKQARARQVGLWSDPKPTPPWLYRRGDKAASMLSPTQTDEAAAEIGARIQSLIAVSKALRAKS